LPCGDESSEEHSCGYVTSERHSRKAKEPRPFGLLPLKRLAVLVLRTAVTLRQKNTAVRSTDGIYDPAAVVTLRQKNTAVRSTSLLAPCQTLQENATRPMATFAMSSSRLLKNSALLQQRRKRPDFFAPVVVGKAKVRRARALFRVILLCWTHL